MKNIFYLIIILLFCISCSGKKEPIIDSKNNIISSIISHDQSFDYEFLSYIYNNYGEESLEVINDALQDSIYDEKIWHEITGMSLNVLNDYYHNTYDNADNIKVIDTKGNINLSFVGDISLADNWEIMPYYDSRGKGVYGIIGEEVVDIMKSSDITIANNEFTVSNMGNKLPNKLYTFRAKPERLSIYNEMGVDLVSIANNHAYDYGEEAFLDTLDSLKEYNIAYVGGGRDISEARKPYYFIAGGYKIAFIGATRAEKYILTPEATERRSGVFRAYDPTMLLETISEVKKKSDYVILLIHWGKEDSHELEEVQIKTSKMYIDAGADLLIGSHAHVLQGMEFYKDKLIAYNLGDFIFNRETKDTGILSISIANDGKINYNFIPCLQDNFKTTIPSENDKNRIIKDLQSYSINTIFNSDGTFSPIKS